MGKGGKYRVFNSYGDNLPNYKGYTQGPTIQVKDETGNCKIAPFGKLADIMTDGYQSCCIKLVTGNQVWDKPVSYSAKNKELMFERFFVSLEDVRYLLFCNPKPKRKRKSRAKDAKVATP